MGVDNGGGWYEQRLERDCKVGFDLAHHFFDMLAERWHAMQYAPTHPSLHQFMGLSWEQYAAFVEGRYSEVLPAAYQKVDPDA